MQNKKRLNTKFSILIIGLFLLSCSRITPSGFWIRYKSNFITEKLIDQGPWGGTLSINWVTEKNDKFNIGSIIELASENDWDFIDSTEYKMAELKNWTEFGKPIINLPLENFEPIPKNDLKSESFQRWIKTDFKLYRFKTGWLIFESGTDDSTQENGFVLISSDNRRMTIYHLWGE